MSAGLLAHRDSPSIDRWYRIIWQRDLPVEAVHALFSHLAAVRRPAEIIFEIHHVHGVVSHLVGVAACDSERLLHAFTTILPDVALQSISRQTPEIIKAVTLFPTSRERRLRTDDTAQMSQSLLAALTAMPMPAVVQLRLSERVRPQFVERTSTGLPSWGKAVRDALLVGNRPLEPKARAELQAKVGSNGFRANLRLATSSPNGKTLAVCVAHFKLLQHRASSFAIGQFERM